MADKQASPYRVIVGGHICLDIIPSIQDGPFQMVPGKLLNVGQAMLATGGAVANTGIALHRLGMPVQLMGKVGTDIFGEAILSLIRREHESLTEGMIVSEGESSSYTIVMSPPKVDRMFLHCTGANDTFGAEDVSKKALDDAGLFHFGYPPLMRRMYEHGGQELAALMRRAKLAGATTSLDMAKPDPNSPAGHVDWREILRNVLPYVDLFLPSVEEILYMLHKKRYEEMVEHHGSEHIMDQIGPDLLQELSSELLGMGAAVVALKLGEHGLYMRSTAEPTRMENTGRYRPEHVKDWLGRDLLVPCFIVETAGTTGAGDCTIAGFLSAFIQGLSPEETLIRAVGTGACNVEQPDATSGIPTWVEVTSRIASGWKQHAPKFAFSGYHSNMHGPATVYHGIGDIKT
ncbi:carbohydrate kinase family protein [Paenibacillus lautus]|uniref:carbohydrate kinase family protein n=1 Tax=Paenibacillus lautus TaxID=1401 RepID=UPI002DBC19BF|nr:carbohydrate kinase family protein [Paenibacillus lautus]MEC0260050.1 carbohydrate kinase family protein [Paenibacillus lautus]